MELHGLPSAGHSDDLAKKLAEADLAKKPAEAGFSEEQLERKRVFCRSHRRDGGGA